MIPKTTIEGNIMQNNVWEWMNGKSLNKIIVSAGVAVLIVAAFRTEILEFLKYQLDDSLDAMESSSGSSEQEPTTTSTMSTCSDWEAEKSPELARAQVETEGKEKINQRKISKEESKEHQGIDNCLLLQFTSQ